MITFLHILPSCYLGNLGALCDTPCLWCCTAYGNYHEDTFIDGWDPQSLYKPLFFLNDHLQVHSTTGEYLDFMSCSLSSSKYELQLSYIHSLLKARSSFRRSLPFHYSDGYILLLQKAPDPLVQEALDDLHNGNWQRSDSKVSVA